MGTSVFTNGLHRNRELHTLNMTIMRTELPTLDEAASQPLLMDGLYNMSSKAVPAPRIRKSNVLVTVLSPFSTSQSYHCFSLSSYRASRPDQKAGFAQPNPFMVLPHPTQTTVYLLQTANSQKRGPCFYHHSCFLLELCIQSVPSTWMNELW